MTEAEWLAGADPTPMLDSLRCVRLLQGRVVVDPVPGHGNDLPLRLEGLDDPELVLGRHPGEHPGPGRHGLAPFGVEPGELPPVDDPERAAVGPAVEPELAAELGRGRLLVPGDHDRPDSGRPAARGGGLGLGPKRADQPDVSDEHEAALVCRHSGARGLLLVRQGQDPQGPAGEL
jgi:hypothetical protein